MAEEVKQEENPFDTLAAIIKPAESYEDAYKRVWTAMKSGTLPEEKVIKILLSACAMPALCAANIKMEKILRDNGLIAELPQEQAAPAEVPAEAPAPLEDFESTLSKCASDLAAELEGSHTTKEPTEEAHKGARILQFPSKGPVVN